MRLKGLDLNLLVTLEALLGERNVSRAADRLGITQPAASSALGRLRQFFKDDILTPAGGRMMPTAHAEVLEPLLRDVLISVERLMSASSVFDPSSARRTFRVVASDYITTVLLAPLLPEIERLAPHIRLELILPADCPRDALARGEIDLKLALDDTCCPEHPIQHLLDEEHVVVGWDQNPALARPLTEDEFFELGHIGVGLGSNQRESFAERHLGRLGRQRRIEVVAPSFSAVAWMLPQSYRVSVMHERLAHAFLVQLPLKIQPLPFPFPVMREVVQYNRNRELDSGLHWLLNLIRAQAAVAAADRDAMILAAQ